MSAMINGNDLIALGYPQNELLGIALKINKKRNGFTKVEMLQHYAAILVNAENYLNDAVFQKLATAIINGVGQPKADEELIPLLPESIPYQTYGAAHIEEGALMQMRTAMQLPVAVAGALMPDAHQGYGLPIGGVLATRNAIIPYGVGVDIGCRMALSIFDMPASKLETDHLLLQSIIMKHTAFGAGNGFKGQYKANHEVLDHKLFQEIDFIQNLKDKAWEQLGSSGGGNHFVEFGVITFESEDKTLGIEKGAYLALLTHSGSRGFGATIANRYTQIAKEKCKLPYEARQLAYLAMNSSEGMEYWLAMNLAGDYAAACHQIIHQKIAKALGAAPLALIENHHNFAWKEIHHGEELMVHRKGATPAGKDVMGIIPGSMATPGFLVRGKGSNSSLHSASHGAGRLMSRTAAHKNISNQSWKKVLDDAGVTLLGAGKDEAPMAYKDIHTVMQAQQDLVAIVATFQPKIVRMADDGSRED